MKLNAATLGLMITLCLPICGFTSENLEQQLLNCKVLPDSLERLVCYDRITTDLVSTSSVEAKSPAAGLDPEPESMTDRKSDSKETAEAVSTRERAMAEDPASAVETRSSIPSTQTLPSSNRRQESAIVESTVVRIDQQPRGELIVTLDNGQVWTQTSSKRLRLDSGEAIVIKEGLFGGFQLFPVKGRPVRVRRLR